MMGDQSTVWAVTSGYKPSDHGVGIVHLGPGAFHRAHQAVYTDTALARDGGDWRSLGVSLQSRKTVDDLNRQDGRYTVVVRGLDKPEYRVIGSIAGGLTAADGGAPILEAIARPGVRILSLTVTEKAYRAQEGEDAPAIIKLITEALGLRRSLGAGAITLMSCDNLTDNGKVLQRAVLDHAQATDAALADWIGENTAFPATMVDRITPASDASLQAEIRDATGREDHAAVQTEDFSQWVIEDSFSNGRPAWESAGALIVSDVRPYEHMKLRMLNGAHSMLAYAGFLSGHKYVRDVMASPGLAALVARHMKAAAETLDPLPGIDFEDYAQSLCERFQNPNIAHETYQIAMDGSQKMQQRIFAPAQAAITQGQDTSAFAFAAAAWIRYVAGKNDEGKGYELRDPRAGDLTAAVATGSARDKVQAIFALPDLAPADLTANTGFTGNVEKALSSMLEIGMAGAIEREAANFV